jgi:hypothetical protein
MTAIFTDRLGLDWDGDDPQEAKAAEAIDLTLNNVASYIAGRMWFDDLAEEHLDALDDAAYDELLDMVERDPELLAKAVIALLVPRATDIAAAMVQQVRDLDECPEVHYQQKGDTT